MIQKRPNGPQQAALNLLSHMMCNMRKRPYAICEQAGNEGPDQSAQTDQACIVSELQKGPFRVLRFIWENVGS